MRRAVAMCLSMCLLLLAVEARADWGDNDISDIINNVKTITGRVTADVPETVADFKRQLDMLRTQGIFITEVVPEILEFLMHRRTPLLDFMATPSGPSCAEGSGSPCDEFRGQLIDFFANVALLNDRFPAIQQLGLGDGLLAGRMLERMPGFVLFPAYEVLNRIPDWELVPHQIAEVIDEIGDPEAFSTDWRQDLPIVTTARAATVRGAAAPSIRKASDRFCERLAPKILDEGGLPADPVFLNRLKVGLIIPKLVLASLAEYLPKDIQVAIVGEGGGSFPIQWGAHLKAIANVFDLAVTLLEARRANVDVCRTKLRDIEDDLLSRTARLQYRTQAGNDEVFFYLGFIIDAARVRAQNVTTAMNKMNIALGHRELRKWDKAFDRMCDAYQAIGQEP